VPSVQTGHFLAHFIEAAMKLLLLAAAGCCCFPPVFVIKFNICFRLDKMNI